MSGENVEATKAAVAALNRGDLESLEEFYAADAVLQDLRNAPDQPVTVEGVQAIRQTLNLWAAAFDELRVDIEEYVDGPDAVICAAHWQGQGKASGISIDVHQFDLYEFREGSVVRAVLGFRSKNDALEAAGLSEQALSEDKIETLHRAIEAFDRGAEDEWIAAWHPDAELHDFTELPDVPQPYRGREGVRQWAANVRSVIGDFQMNPRGFTVINDAVLMDLEIHGVGERSGAPVGTTVYILAWIQGGQISRTRAFLDRTEALEAAGLSA
jgi:ketosteroid isomerase-like protein